METETKEIVIIGGGLMGSAAAWHLSRSGKKVTLFEQQGPDYTYGSSLGKTRIARSLGPQKDIFSYFHNRSVQETEKLIEFLNREDESATHRMEQVYTTSPVTYIYYTDRQKAVEELLDNQKDPVEYAATPEQAKEKFGMEVSDKARVLRERKKYSGTLHPDVLIRKLHKAVTLNGGNICYRHQVRHIQKSENGYEVEMSNTQSGESQTICCRQLVAAVGPYTGKLFREIAPRFEELITPKRVFLVYVKMKGEAFSRLSDQQLKKIEESYPLIDFTPEITFAMIDEHDAEGSPVIKIGGHLLREEITDLDQVWQQPLSEAEKAFGIRSTAGYLQRLGIPVREDELIIVKGNSCVYSLTDSEIPLVTHRLDENDRPDSNFVVMGGMSGVGAKGAMTYGLIASNLLLGETEDSKMYRMAVTALGSGRQLQQAEKTEAAAEDGTIQRAWFVS